MTPLYVAAQGAHVGLRAGRIVVTHEGKTVTDAPLTQVDQVVVLGRGVQLSTALLVELLTRGVPVTLTNQRGSRHYATLTAGPSPFVELRLAQARLAQEPDAALGLARSVVAAKLANQARLLAGTGWAAARPALARIEVAQVRAAEVGSVESLMGVEGAAAAAYFGAWRAALPPAWGFAGRAHHPPPDPVNALLSFGYTLALHDVLTAVQMTGLDPYLGFLHGIERGRPSLALDLLEEFRPWVVDRLVLDLLRSDQLRHEQFTATPDAGSRLDAAGRRRLIDGYEGRVSELVSVPGQGRTTVRRLFLLQAQALARVVRGEAAEYAGFTAWQAAPGGQPGRSR